VRNLGVISYVKSKLKPPKQAVTIQADDSAFVEKLCSEFGLTQRLNGLLIDRFATNVAINLIAGLVSKCEFKTYTNGVATKGKEYYLWNIEPNVNQSSTQFLQEFVYRLLKNNECLVIENVGQLMIAESFSQTEFALIQNNFSNVTRAGFTFNKIFKMSEVMYTKLNCSDVARLLSNIQSSYDALISEAIEKYKKSGGEKIILNIGSVATGNKDFEKNLENLMTNRFKTFFENKNAVLPLTEGYTANRQSTETNRKSSSEIADIKTLTAESFERVGQAFKIPSAILKGDIADVGQLTDNLLTFCIDPLCDLISEEATRKRYGMSEFLKGNYIKIDTTCVKHIDIFSIAEKIDKLIASGMYSIDEVREKAGDTPLNTDYSQRHWITKNYQDINFIEGGDNIE